MVRQTERSQVKKSCILKAERCPYSTHKHAELGSSPQNPHRVGAAAYICHPTDMGSRDSEPGVHRNREPSQREAGPGAAEDPSIPALSLECRDYRHTAAPSFCGFWGSKLRSSCLVMSWGIWYRN